MSSTSRTSKIKRNIPLWLVILLIASSVIVTTAAITIFMLQVEYINIWGGSVQDTQFSVVTLETSIKGPNKIEIVLTIRNDDSSVHSASVTVQLLDSGDNIILEETKMTGDVMGAGDWSGTYSFTKTGLVAEYTKPFVVIKQLS